MLLHILVPMMSLRYILLFAAIAAGVWAPATVSASGGGDISAALAMVRSSGAECVLVRGGEIISSGRGRGVDPLLSLYDDAPAAFTGAAVVDKVIGRAAAFIAVSGKAGYVYGLVMSEDAEELLLRHGVECGYDEKVPRILNRSRDGLCPLEASVQGIESPEAALDALRRRVSELGRSR